MARSPFLGLPAVCAGALFLVSVAEVARATLVDPTLGTGVPEAALLGFGVLVLVVAPSAVAATVALGMALKGIGQLPHSRTGPLTAASWLALAGCGWFADMADDGVWQAVGVSGVVLALVTLVGLEVGTRRAVVAGTTGA